MRGGLRRLWLQSWTPGQHQHVLARLTGAPEQTQSHVGQKWPGSETPLYPVTRRPAQPRQELSSCSPVAGPVVTAVPGAALLKGERSSATPQPPEARPRHTGIATVRQQVEEERKREDVLKTLGSSTEDENGEVSVPFDNSQVASNEHKHSGGSREVEGEWRRAGDRRWGL